MSEPAINVEVEALALTKDARVRLAIKLLESIEHRSMSDPAEIERAWVREANRRYADYLAGKEIAVPADDVFAELRK